MLLCAYHDIKLLGVGDKLHGRVVHDHLFKLNVWVELGHVCTALQEQTVPELHDVGLVNRSHLHSTHVKALNEALKNFQSRRNQYV